MSSVPPNPNQRPPSYSLLGILLAIRLLHRLSSIVSSLLPQRSPQPSLDDPSQPEKNSSSSSSPDKETYIDSTSVPSLVPPRLVAAAASEGEDGKDFWGDRTILDVEQLPADVRAARRCALCLEERTASAVTECGHVFCWTCIVGWGREKVRCLSLSLIAHSFALAKTETGGDKQSIRPNAHCVGNLWLCQDSFLSTICRASCVPRGPAALNRNTITLCRRSVCPQKSLRFQPAKEARDQNELTSMKLRLAHLD